jgi:integrase
LTAALSDDPEGEATDYEPGTDDVGHDVSGGYADRQRRQAGNKQDGGSETRSIPIPSVLVELFRNYLKRYGTASDGRIFATARGGPLNDTGYGEVWDRARRAALTPAQQATPLARRPYDLRHAAVSL